MNAIVSPSSTQLYKQIQALVVQQRQLQEAAIAQMLRQPEPLPRVRGLHEKRTDDATQPIVAQMISTVAQSQSLSALLAQYQQQMQKEFRAIEQRDRNAGRFQVWLTVLTSVISLILGWLLSLVKSPAVFTEIVHH